jgi:hypothetical protein
VETLSRLIQQARECVGFAPPFPPTTKGR